MDAEQRRRHAAGKVVDETVPPIDSSSVLLCREVHDGLEVFMLERILKADFAGGAYVFPGGKVDEADRHLDPARWTGVDLPHAPDLLGTDTEADALGFLVAAVRETFEEAGVLLATRDGSPLDATDLATDSFRTARARMNDRDTPWDWQDWLAEEGLILDLGALAFWSWWVTPEGSHRRFDTRFFLARAPRAQVEGLAHDQVENVASRWLTPAGALAAGESGEVTIIYPTRKNLEALAAYGSVEEVWDAAVAGKVDQRRIQPSIVWMEDGHPMIQHPDGGPPEAM